MSEKSKHPKHVFEPFEDLLREIRESGHGKWREIEGRFLRAAGAFDAEYAAGERTRGWYQSKARYFNDIVVAMLENLSGRELTERVKKRSQLFAKIDVDICFPATDTPLVAGEVKCLGTPPHPGNKGRARDASQDLHKRAREVAFTAMDLKAAYAAPRKIGSFQQWVETTSPGYFSFWAMRVASKADLERVKTTLSLLRNYCNGVGAVIYGSSGEGLETKYSVRSAPVLAMDLALREMAQRMS